MRSQRTCDHLPSKLSDSNLEAKLEPLQLHFRVNFAGAAASHLPFCCIDRFLPILLAVLALSGPHLVSV